MQTSSPSIWVLGLGITGLSCVRYLHAQGLSVAVWDTRPTPPGAEQLAAEFPQVALKTGPFEAKVLAKATTLVVSPGVALATPEIKTAIDSGVEAIGDIELFARAADKPVIAITGSNGKSTVTTLVGEMIAAQGMSVGVGGNIGEPALALLGKDHDCYVLELSSFQLETTSSLKPRIATVLNVSDDHLDRYRDFNHYRDTKLTIYRNAERVLESADDANTHSGRVDAIRFGLNVGDFRVEAGQLLSPKGPLMATEEMALVGGHNHLNALASMALVQAVGVGEAAMKTALKTFAGLRHRCQSVVVKHGVHYVNDSKATNIGATEAALMGLTEFAGRIHLIAGGDGKGADFSQLAPLFANSLKSLTTLGKDGQALATTFAHSTYCDTLEQAFAHAAALAEPGEMVLLSPACASIDMFANYMVRGDRFCQLAEAL